jgi:acyl carrier protein
MSTITIEEALQMLADCIEADADALKADTPRDSLPGWDSMGALALMAELDERFELELTADESRQMQSVRDVLDYLRRHERLAA